MRYTLIRKEQTRRFQGTTGLQVQPKQTIGVNVPIKERVQGPEFFRLRPCPEPLPVHRRVNQEYHAQQRPCYATFLIAYEGLSHLPSRSQLRRLGLACEISPTRKADTCHQLDGTLTQSTLSVCRTSRRNRSGKFLRSAKSGFSKRHEPMPCFGPQVLFLSFFVDSFTFRNSGFSLSIHLKPRGEKRGFFIAYKPLKSGTENSGNFINRL